MTTEGAASLESKFWRVWTPDGLRVTSSAMRKRASISVSLCFCWALFLVDLVGFEPTTSSMPWKKYQSLTGKTTRKERLSVIRFGRRWTPRRGVFQVWTPPGLRDSTSGTASRVPSHAPLPAVFDCCLLEEATLWCPHKGPSPAQRDRPLCHVERTAPSVAVSNATRAARSSCSGVSLRSSPATRRTSAPTDIPGRIRRGQRFRYVVKVVNFHALWRGRPQPQRPQTENCSGRRSQSAAWAASAGRAIW